MVVQRKKDNFIPNRISRRDRLGGSINYGQNYKLTIT